MASPTIRSLAWLRDKGYHAEVVEKVIPYKYIKVDFLGFIDIIAIKKNRIVGVQVTSGSNVSARIKKAKASPNLKLWLEAGGIFVVHGWRKLGKKGKRKTWQVRIVRLQ